jgi:hypothetical protein
MSFSVVPDKSVGDIFTEVMWDTYIKDNMNKGVMRPIGDTTLGFSAASITFSSITTDWAHLWLVFYGRGDSIAPTQAVTMRFNSDSGANYDHTDFNSNNTGAFTPGSREQFAQTSFWVGLMPAGTASANLFGGPVVFIPNYANTANNKCMVGHSAQKTAATTGLVMMDTFGGQWRSNAAITTVTLLPGANNFVTGTRATLYGLGF